MILYPLLLCAMAGEFFFERHSHQLFVSRVLLLKHYKQAVHALFQTLIRACCHYVKYEFRRDLWEDALNLGNC